MSWSIVLAIFLVAARTVSDAAAAAEHPDSCSAHELAYHAKLHMVVLLNCGVTAREGKGRVWGWNGTTWTLVNSGAPLPRQLGGATYDSRRNVLVMYGGVQFLNGKITDFPETWEWTARSWKKIEAATPDVSNRFAMTFDEARGEVVLQGGQGANGVGKGDTWTWDGRRWIRIAGSGPDPEEHQALAYDSRRKRVLLFGGFHQPEDFWEWQGSRWRAWPGDVPRARSHSCMAYDEKSDQLILFGGLGQRVWLSETWILQKESWTRYKGPGPSARGLCAMAYDKTRGKIVLYGGEQTPFEDGARERPLGDTWEWDGRQWLLMQP